MREHPDGLTLLDLAVSTLREQVLPALPEAQKYVGLMVVNALSIAARQLTSNDQPLQHSRERLESVLGQKAAEGTLDAQLVELSRALANAVRNGKYDSDPQAHRALWDITVQRVRESAPRYLQSEGIE
jgi:hypothetical protein